jgi:hypothetical protein
MVSGFAGLRSLVTTKSWAHCLAEAALKEMAGFEQKQKEFRTGDREEPARELRLPLGSIGLYQATSTAHVERRNVSVMYRILYFVAFLAVTGIVFAALVAFERIIGG